MRWLPAVALLTACVQRAPLPPSEVYEPAPLAESSYADAARQGTPVYRIDPMSSLVLIHVGRAGSMQNLGHEHIIASRDLDGFVLVADDPLASRADLHMSLHSLIVDNGAYRERYGLDPDVPESAVEGTTRNMQDKVLQSQYYPTVEVVARFASAIDDPPTMNVSITLHGTAFEYTVPVKLEIRPDELSAKGTMTVTHADFGMIPFKAAGGLLSVAENIELEYELVAKSWQPPML